MNDISYPDGHLDNEISLDQIISEVSKYHIKVIEGLQRSSDVTSSDNKRELRKLLYDRENFVQLRRFLLYAKHLRPDADKIIDFLNSIKGIYGKRQSLIDEVHYLINDIIMLMKLPTIDTEVTSYLINRGNYDLLNINLSGVTNFDNLEEVVYEEMEKIIRKKVLASQLPSEDLVLEIKEGILTVKSTKNFYSFEMTLYYNSEHKDFDWFLLSFEHSLETISKVDKKIKRIQDEIVKLYQEGRRDVEGYIISFIAHKIKYYYTRKKAEISDL